MEYALITAAVASFWIVFNFIFKRSVSHDSVTISQTYIHEIMSSMMVETKPKQKTQSQMHTEKNTVKVAISHDKAYWVENNVFYVADIVDGFIDKDSASQVDTINIDDVELKHMLKILDSLKEE